MRKKIYFIVFILMFLFLKASATEYEASNFGELKTILDSIQSETSTNRIIKIKGNIDLASSLTENLNLELIGSDFQYNFDLKNYTLTFNGANKTSKLSNLNIIENNPNNTIISKNSEMAVDNCILNGHDTAGKELIGNSSGKLDIINSKLLNNKSNFGAGAFYNDDKTTSTIDNTEFKGNEVTTGSTGGAIVNKGSLTIKNGSKFINNKVELGSGGAISNSGTLYIEDTLFESNLAKNDGGAITDTGSSIIKNSIFRKNQSTDYYGGAITSIHDLEIEGCTFEENSSYSYGGAIAAMMGNTTITNSNFIKNTSKSNLGGGAIINYLGTLDLKGENSFIENTSLTDGGAITNTTKSTMNIYSGTKFLNNKADNLGGAIYSHGTVIL